MRLYIEWRGLSKKTSSPQHLTVDARVAYSGKGANGNSKASDLPFRKLLLREVRDAASRTERATCFRQLITTEEEKISD